MRALIFPWLPKKMQKRVLKFSAAWCGPCNQIREQVVDVCKELDLELVEIDIDEDSACTLVQTHGVTKLPTLVFCRDDGTSVKHEGASMNEIRLKAQALKTHTNQIVTPLLDAAKVT